MFKGKPVALKENSPQRVEEMKDHICQELSLNTPKNIGYSSTTVITDNLKKVLPTLKFIMNNCGDPYD